LGSQHAIDLVRCRQYDVIIVDLNSGGRRGLEICRELRGASPLPGILVLMPRDSAEDQVEVLDAGADGCFVKPLGFGELLARLRVIRRRQTRGQYQTARIAVGEIALDCVDHTVKKSGCPLHLSPIEFRVLEYLMRNAGMPIKHRALLRAIWGPDYGDELQYLRVFVCQLRKKLEDDPAHPPIPDNRRVLGL
jgi:two-component system KDP operon response regulator KdpE